MLSLDSLQHYSSLQLLGLLSGTILTLYLLYTLTTGLYDVYFGPLSQYPGPKLRAFTNIPSVYNMIIGNEPYDHAAPHAKYGPIVRYAPKMLSYVSANSWNDIYGFKSKQRPSIPYKDTDWTFFYSPRFNDADDLINADNQNHGRMRKILSHSFSDRALREQEPLLNGWARKMVVKLREQASRGGPVDLVRWFNFTTFDMISDLTFGENLHMLDGGEYGSYAERIRSMLFAFNVQRALKMFGPSVSKLIDRTIRAIPATQAAQYELVNFANERVDKRLAREPDRSDFWTNVLAKGMPGSGGNELNLAEHHSNAFLFIVAGGETPGSGLAGITYYLLRNPDCHKRLVEEIRSAFSSAPESLSLDSLARLKYLEAVINEGLRMYPPPTALFPRTTPPGGMEIEGQYVPAGTVVGIPEYAAFRYKPSFHKADDFCPERWMDGPEFANDQLDAVQVFSVGPRNCIGKNLAQHEMRLILATLLLHFDVELCEESFHWNDQVAYLNFIKKPLMVKLTPVRED